MNIKIKAYYVIVIGFFLFVNHNGYAQNQKKADSLKEIYNQDIVSGEAKLELLRQLAFHTITNIDETLNYANELLLEAQKDSNYLYIYRGYSQIGQARRMAGDMPEALSAFFKACETAARLDDKKYLGGGYSTIADVYSEIGNTDNAYTYYDKSIAILRESNDSVTLASALLNFGYDKFINGKLNEALIDYKESSTIFKSIDYPIGVAYNLGNIGMVYAEQGRDELAMKNINSAIEILEKNEDYYAISEYLTTMSNVYVKQQKITTALEYDHKSLDLAKKYKLKNQISQTNLSLSDLYDQLGNAEASLYHYKEHIKYKDSINNIEKVEAIADMRTNYEVSQKQLLVENIEQKRKTERLALWSTLGVLFLIGLLTLGLFKRNKFIKATNKIIAMEKERSDNLLLNILPEETAQELKDNGRVEAKKFNSVTVLFSDFKGFTHYAENLSPELLVKTVDYYFSNFDLIMEKYGLEKIKTVGDAYMAAGGLPFETKDHAHKMIEAAIEITNFVALAKDDPSTTASFDIRIGINTGPVVAGVVGTKKFAYDIWGDTVNIASRMESNSEPGRINISENTYDIVKETYKCEYRGEIRAKNRGDLKMYFINHE